MESSSESLPLQEEIDRLPQWNSAYKSVALKTMELRGMKDRLPAQYTLIK